jgi:hypothetical protein
MTCQRCIKTQRKLVEFLCRKSGGFLCRKARERLEQMLSRAN